MFLLFTDIADAPLSDLAAAQCGEGLLPITPMRGGNGNRTERFGVAPAISSAEIGNSKHSDPVIYDCKFNLLMKRRSRDVAPLEYLGKAEQEA
jgi:hypothetical protein